MKIRFSKHALEKFAILRRHGVHISKQQVLEAIKKPELMDYSRLPLLIVQCELDKNRVLRVVHKVEQNAILIITFYPGKRSQYEK